MRKKACLMPVKIDGNDDVAEKQSCEHSSRNGLHDLISGVETFRSRPA
ncbi:hypothetical protein HXZ66_19300 [Bacillus sp. A116_S68]|nr:hypothetical protein HXZ66_19300 [Bacillus sp. A116_S68]